MSVDAERVSVVLSLQHWIVVVATCLRSLAETRYPTLETRQITVQLELIARAVVWTVVAQTGAPY